MNKIKKYTKEIFSFLIVLLIASSIINIYKSKDLNKNKFDLTNIKLIDDFNYTYSKNEVLILHFWATWCPICKIEAPNIQDISKTNNVLTIATNSGDDTNVKNYMKENNITFNVLNDKYSTLAKKFNIEVYPTTLIYDKNGNLAFSEVGYTSTLGLKLRIWWAGL
jgi:thiol-disulfide isomerase/thioredoxin